MEGPVWKQAPSSRGPPSWPLSVMAGAGDYTVLCTFREFGDAVCRALDAGLIEMHGGDATALETKPNAWPLHTVERELRRLYCRQRGANRCVSVRADPPFGLTLPQPEVLLFCTKTGDYGSIALDMAHESMAGKAAILETCIRNGWLASDSKSSAVCCSHLCNPNSAKIARFALRLTTTETFPATPAWNTLDEGSNATRHARLVAAVAAQTAAEAAAGGVQPPLAYGTHMMRALDAMKKALPCEVAGCQSSAEVLRLASLASQPASQPSQHSQPEKASSLPDVCAYQNDSPETPVVDEEMLDAVAAIPAGHVAELPESGGTPAYVRAAAAAVAADSPPVGQPWRPLPDTLADLTPGTGALLHRALRPPMVVGEVDAPRTLRSDAASTAMEAALMHFSLPAVAGMDEDDVLTEIRDDLSPFYCSSKAGVALGLPEAVDKNGKPAKYYPCTSAFRDAALLAPYADDPTDPRFHEVVDIYMRYLESRIPRCANHASSLYFVWHKRVPCLEHFSVVPLFESLLPDGYFPGEREDAEARSAAANARQAADFAKDRAAIGCPCNRSDNGRTFALYGECCHCQNQPEEEMCCYCRPKTFAGWKGGGRGSCRLRVKQRAEGRT